MPPLLVAVATPKKKPAPLERPGLAPPPFGERGDTSGGTGRSYTAPTPKPEGPGNKLAAAAALASLAGAAAGGDDDAAPSRSGDPYADDAAPGLDAEKETVAGDSGGAMFTQEQSGYCDAQTRCKTCDYMIQPNACTYVKGYIDDDGCCPLHSSRGEASEALEPQHAGEGAADELG